MRGVDVCSAMVLGVAVVSLVCFYASENKLEKNRLTTSAIGWVLIGVTNDVESATTTWEIAELQTGGCESEDVGRVRGRNVRGVPGAISHDEG